MKKNILAIAAAIMMVGTITFVACNKDSDTNQIVNPSYVSAKGGSTLNQLRNVMVAYYAACDSAYQADSTTFLSICANNDTINFLKVTGISSELLSAYRSLALQEYVEFLKDNPDFKFDEKPCASCANSALPRFGILSSKTSGHLSALIPLKIENDNLTHLLNCIKKCEEITTSNRLAMCLSTCIAEKYDDNYVPYKRTHNVLIHFFSVCDSAYLNDSSLFVNICDKDDTVRFLEMINVSDVEYNLMLKEIADDYIISSRKYKGESASPCTSCGNGSLTNIANAEIASQGTLAIVCRDIDDYAFCLSMCSAACGILGIFCPPAALFCLSQCLLNCSILIWM